MNTTPENPVPPPPIPTKKEPHELTPMETGGGMGAAIASLLKSPGSILFELTCGNRAGKVSLSLWIITVLGLLAFGGVTATFAEDAWWIAPSKITGGVLFSALICLPSLYIFSALGGMALKLNAISGILLSMTGLTALLMAGFTPLVWVFGQSTGSLSFIGGLMLVIWLFSLLFGMKLLMKCSRALGLTDAVHLWIWCAMFILVTLQMSCALRPILGKSDKFFPTDKKFFLQHWADSIQEDKLRPQQTASTVD